MKLVEILQIKTSQSDYQLKLEGIERTLADIPSSRPDYISKLASIEERHDQIESKFETLFEMFRNLEKKMASKRQAQ